MWAGGGSFLPHSRKHFYMLGYLCSSLEKVGHVCLRVGLPSMYFCLLWVGLFLLLPVGYGISFTVVHWDRGYFCMLKGLLGFGFAYECGMSLLLCGVAFTPWCCSAARVRPPRPVARPSLRCGRSAEVPSFS